MASIRKKDNGSYQIIVSQGYDLQGKKIRKTTTFKPTKTTEKAIEKEVQAFARKFEDRVLAGECYDGEKIKLKDFVQNWYDNWAVQNLTKSAQEQYLYQLNKKVLPKIGHLYLAKIKPAHIKDIITEMNNAGYATKTIKYMFTSINSVMKYAEDMEVIDRNPCTKVGKIQGSKPKKEGQSFSRDQAVRFLKFLDESVMRDADAREGNEKVISILNLDPEDASSLQYRCYFNLAIYAGLRRGEMIALTWNDIDFDTRKITIDKAVARTNGGQITKDPKTKKGKRTFILPKTCVVFLRQWRSRMNRLAGELGSKWEGLGCYDAERREVSGENNVFIDCNNGKAMNLDTPYHKLKKIIDAYNKTVDDPDDRLPSIRLHDLRHTCATMMLSENVDIETIANRMGHLPSVALDIYGHPLEEMDARASDLLEEVFAIRG